MTPVYQCLECGKTISQGIYDYSTDQFGHPLCLKHQVALNESGATTASIALYLALKLNKVPVELEYRDGRNNTALAIPGKIYIEIDDEYQPEHEQALIDFFETVHSLKEDMPTFRISNAHIDNTHQFEMIVERLTEICTEQRKTA
jgi:hypothetical protein